MPFAEVAGVRLFFTDDGQGDPPLVLVHGWGADSHEWCWHLDALSERHRVVAVDLRGHGRSSVPDTGNDPQHMASDIAGLLGRLATGPVIAVGHSMGGQVVSVLAVEHPQVVRAIVTVDPGYGVTGPVTAAMPDLVAGLQGTNAALVAQQIEGGWSFTAATPPVVRQWHLRRLAGMPPHVLAQAFAAMFTDTEQFGLRPASEIYLRRRACPVLSLWADPEQATWETALFAHPASRALPFPGSGHYLHEERPGEFVIVLERWLETLTAHRDAPTP